VLIFIERCDLRASMWTIRPSIMESCVNKPQKRYVSF